MTLIPRLLGAFRLANHRLELEDERHPLNEEAQILCRDWDARGAPLQRRMTVLRAQARALRAAFKAARAEFRAAKEDHYDRVKAVQPELRGREFKVSEDCRTFQFYKPYPHCQPAETTTPKAPPSWMAQVLEDLERDQPPQP